MAEKKENPLKEDRRETDTDDVQKITTEKEKTKPSEISSLDAKAALPESEELLCNDSESPGKSKTVYITLAGTHTGSTETESTRTDVPIDYANFPFEHSGTESSSTGTSKETIRELKPEALGPKDAALPYSETKAAAKKRQQNEMGGAQGSEVAKRMRSEHESEPVAQNSAAENTNSPASKAEKSEVENLIEKYAEGPPKLLKETVQAKEPEVPVENPEIAERFQLIIEMFDNFTKNLESLDLVAEKNSPRIVRKKHSSERVVSPRVHRSRYTDYLETKRTSLQRQDMDKNECSTSKRLGITHPHISEVKFMPPSKDIATTTSHIEFRGDTTKDKNAEFLATTIACQTFKTCAQANLINKNLGTATSASATRLELRKLESAGKAHDTSVMGESGTCCQRTYSSPTKKNTSELSGFTLLKVSEPSSTLELSAIAPTVALPCERTYHTIHIEATASPTLSAMQRPPLCTRLWSVITDFCAAVCLCLQVNKDCIFCLGFFIAFVVSASFLTAFFYRTLSVNPQLFQQQGPQNFHERTHASKEAIYIV